MKGKLFLIVGNSGSGKDSLLQAVSDSWSVTTPSLRVVKRYITRKPDPSEDHFSVTKQRFLELKKQGFFCLSWYVYNLHYGIPWDMVDCLLGGSLVMVNASRTIIHQAKCLYPDTKVVCIRAPIKTIEQRIINRGREQSDDPMFRARLERARTMDEQTEADFIIDSSGEHLHENADRLIGFLLGEKTGRKDKRQVL